MGNFVVLARNCSSSSVLNVRLNKHVDLSLRGKKVQSEWYINIYNHYVIFKCALKVNALGLFVFLSFFFKYRQFPILSTVQFDSMMKVAALEVHIFLKRSALLSLRLFFFYSIYFFTFTLDFSLIWLRTSLKYSKWEKSTYSLTWVFIMQFIKLSGKNTGSYFSGCFGK